MPQKVLIDMYSIIVRDLEVMVFAIYLGIWSNGKTPNTKGNPPAKAQTSNSGC